jgi:type III secretion system FlhB-like substrate exporter
MEKIYVQRKIEVWVQETYNVEEISDEIIEAAIDYDIDVDEEETLWETQVDLGPVEVYDENHKVIYSKKI